MKPVVQVFSHLSRKKTMAERYGFEIDSHASSYIYVEIRHANPFELKDLQKLIAAGNSRVAGSIVESSMGLLGDVEDFRQQLSAAKTPYSGLLLQALSNIIEAPRKSLLGLRGSPLVMGIVNVTPDSFSDGGSYFSEKAAVDHALRLLNEGADIIDIGGESTRPGSKSVSVEEEHGRTIPVIREIRKQRPDSVISIDTTKAKVAEAALQAGADIVNDISGGTFEPEILEVTAGFGAAIVLMHTKDRPKVMQNDTNYKDLVREIYDFLYIQIHRAKSVGIEQIAVDPGIGFGKTPGQNWEILDRISDFHSLGCPQVIGLSRKSFLGKLLDFKADQRDTATVIAETAAVLNGAAIIRTHNVQNGVQMKKITTALKEKRQ